MNALPSLSPWLAPLGWLALEVTVVVLVALALQPFLRDAATRRSIWRAVLVALALLLAAEFTGATSQLPAQLRIAWANALPPSPALPPLAPTASELPFAPPPVFPLAPIGGEGRGEVAAPAPEPLQLEPDSSLPPSPGSLSPSPTFSPAPVLVWLTGLAALLARSAWTHAGFAWLRLRHFLPAAETLRQRVQSLATRLGLRRRVRVLASERLRAPAAFGWVRPGVGVPGDFTARFAPAQQDAMLAHELAHLAARDPLWQLLADLAAAALWWHPLAWVARRQHRLAGELAADDASQALPDGPVVLAECLLALGHEAADCPRAALGMAGFRSQLGRRVERLVALPRGDWHAPSRLRLALQTTVALLALAALALLPGCAANRTASETPSRIVAKWWQATSKSPEIQPRGATLLIQPKPKPVFVQGRVNFNGTPPPEHKIPVPSPFLVALEGRIQELDKARKQKVAAIEQDGADYKRLIESAADPNISIQQRDLNKQSAEAKLRDLQKSEDNILESDRASRFLLEERRRVRTNTVITTRFHRVAPDGGLADVLVYVKAGLTNQTFAAPTNAHVIRIQGYEYQPYITAVQTGQPIRWETDVNLNFHPTPTNRANREFNRALMPDRPLEATFTAPEFFLRTKDDVHPWLFGYVSVLPHPYFAVTDADGRFRFPQPLPPGKYTLAAVHRQTGEFVRELDLTQPAPAGQPPEIQFVMSTKPVASYVVAVGDEVRMEVYQRGDLRTQAKVQPDGTLTLPLIGAVKAAGNNLSELRNAIRDAYEAAHFRPAHVTVTLVQSSPPLAPPPLLSTPKQAPDFVPSKPPTREELLERKLRLEAEIKEAEKLYRPTHPKMIGLRKQLESVDEALKEAISSVTNALDISVGRQLFVDDFLIASNTLKRTWHQPVIATATPLMLLSSPTTPPEPMPFCENVWYDTTNQLFRMRFVFSNETVEFHSTNGINWPSTSIRTNAEFASRTALGAKLPRASIQARIGYESHDVVLVAANQWPRLPLLFRRVGTYSNYTTSHQSIHLPRTAEGSRWTDLHPMTNGFLVVGRNLHFYFGGRLRLPGEPQASAAVALATLRRDGFASLDAGLEGGVMTTKPVTFTGRFMFVNMKTNAPNGELRIEILHPDGRPIEITKNDTKERTFPFSHANTIPLAADQTLMGVSWQGGMQDLSMLVGRPVCFRFHLKNASLYSFWTSPSRFGRSLGHVAGGGPHFTNDVDTIGNRSYGVFPVIRTNVPPPKPGAVLPAPAAVVDDVRSPTSPQTPDAKPQTQSASQRLVTSSPTNTAPSAGPLQAAEAEAVRRQERKVALDKLLGEAGQFLKVKSWTSAVVRYEEAIGHAKLLGITNVEKQYRDALAGLTHCRIHLAIELQEKHEFKAAAAEMVKVLPFEPNSQVVEQFKRFNERVEAAHGEKSRKQAPAGKKELLEVRSKVMSLVRDGKLYYEVGEYEEARKRLEEAIALDPMNEAAYFYLRLVQEAQFAQAARKREDAFHGRVVAVTQKWNDSTRSQNGLPVPNPYARTNSQVPFLTHSSKGAQRINRKLDEIVLPEVHFDGVPLVGVVQRLIEDAKKFDPEKQGLNFLINDVSPAAPLLDAAGNPVPVARPVALSEGLVRISTTLRNVTLRQALDVICKTAELPTQFSVEEYAIAFIPRGPVAYYSRIFRVNPDTFIQGLQGVVANPVLGVTPGGGNQPGAAGQTQTTTPTTGPVRATVPATVPATQRTAAEANALVRQFFQSAGVTSLGTTNASTQVFFNPENGLLIARGTTNDLRVIEQAIEKVQPLSVPTQSGPESRAPERDRPGHSSPASTNAAPRAVLPNPYYRTNNSAPFLTHSSKGAQIINRKLDEIILPEIHFDNVSLPAVVIWLDGNVRKFDPEKKGLNFLINNVMSDYISANVPSGAPSGAVPAPIPQVLDPVTGQPRATAAMRRQMPDLSSALIKVTSPIKALTLHQALDAICMTAVVKMPDGRVAGLKYTVEEYAVVFSPKLPEQASLFARVFKVDPETFIRGLASVVADPSEAAKPSAIRVEIDRLLRAKARTNAPASTGQFSVAGVPVINLGKAGVSGVLSTNMTAEINNLVRDYFRAAGVQNLGPTNSPDATQVFFNDRNGLLLVRASLQDLDIIQMAIELLNVKPPQVLIEAKFVEVNQNDGKALGFDWFMGNTTVKPEFKSATNRIVAIDRDGNYRLDGQVRSFDQIVTSLKEEHRANPNLGVRVRTPKDARLDAAMVLLERCSRLGITNVSFSTESITEIERVPARPPSAPNPTGVFPQPALPAGTSTTSGNLTNKLARTNAVGLATLTGILTAPQFAVVMRALDQRDPASVRSLPKVTTPSGKPVVLELPADAKAGGGFVQGLKLEVLPSVAADGYTLNLTIIVSRDGRAISVSQCVAWDGQTVMLGGSELPGAAAKSGAKSPRVVLFLTPTIVNPTGHRVHTDEVMPFAPAAPTK